MSVAPLTTRDIQYPRCYRKSKQLDEARRLLAIALVREQHPVFQEIMGIEG
jgi:hypothetical protein